ncbi:large ribosomal subunit protein mL40 [Aulostomus maculatus]
MASAFSRCFRWIFSRQTAPSSCVSAQNHRAIPSPWFAAVMALRTSAPLRSAGPKRKKKISTQVLALRRQRMQKRLRKMQKIATEFIPIEDFIAPVKILDERARPESKLSFEQSEERALLLKEWSNYKKAQHRAEKEMIKNALEAQREALEELKIESQELYLEALKPDLTLFPFTHQGPAHTPPKPTHDGPDGKYNDITLVYTQ